MWAVRSVTESARAAVVGAVILAACSSSGTVTQTSVAHDAIRFAESFGPVSHVQIVRAPAIAVRKALRISDDDSSFRRHGALWVVRATGDFKDCDGRHRPCSSLTFVFAIDNTNRMMLPDEPLEEFRQILASNGARSANVPVSGQRRHSSTATSSVPASAHKQRISCNYDARGRPKASNPAPCTDPAASKQYDVVCSVDGGGTIDGQNAPACFPTQR